MKGKSTSKEIRIIKLYGGIGQLLIVFTIFLLPIISGLLGFFYSLFNNPIFAFLKNLLSPRVIFILFIFGNILVIISVKKISDVVSKGKEFTKFLIFYILSFFLIISAAGIFLFFLILGFGAAISDIVVPSRINGMLLVSILVSTIAFLLSLFFYKKSMLIISKLTNKKLFRFSGNLILIGGLFLVSSLITLFLKTSNNFFWLFLDLGAFFIFLGLLLPCFGFFRLKEKEIFQKR